MASIIVRNLDDKVKHRLRVRAARHGRSMEAEARAILVEAIGSDEDETNILQRLHERFTELGGVELDIPPRSGTHRDVDFD
ncbi:plasmid stabilization protein [Kribbella solani]|uniref:FitA-like ribbon-helix-helix domain-containing protein n=1 Tax=Kribbella solani TaxID=236067 RepID=UPI0029A06A3A|nr:plasmid stabilization protein [Kribbella solani]MDX2969579.1 plasmid stabilization protein [Kribbella solani]MDX3005781.1 plasmid stabilization protein [Kribbella solani]